jgi:hypothetical protein
MTRGVALAAAFIVLCFSRAAAGDDAPGPSCGAPGHPGILLRAEGLDAELRSHIVDQLRAALAGRSFDLCEPPNGAGAVAELDVTSLADPEAPAVALTLSVRDEITDKRVSRDIDLLRIPEDGRALVIAQAADELLRASWAELLVADAPRPKRDVPPEVSRAVPPPVIAAPPPVAPLVELGASVALEHFGSGLTQLGPDVAVGIFPFARLGAVVRAGIRSGARADAVSGSVDPSSVVTALAVMGGVLPRTGRLGLDAGTELFVTHVHYAAEASPGGRANSASGTAVHASAVARGWVLLAAPLRGTLGVSVGAPIHTVRAVAADSTIAAVSGVLLGAELGVGGAW